MTLAQAVARCAYAISRAEGYQVPNSLPARCCNPGDMKRGDMGCGTIDGKTIFPSHSAGFAALEHQLTLILTGHSEYYTPSLKPPQLAAEWTGSDNPEGWCAIFCALVPIAPDAPLSSLVD